MLGLVCKKSFFKKFLFTPLLKIFSYKFNTAVAGFFNQEYIMTKLQIFASGALFASVIISSGPCFGVLWES